MATERPASSELFQRLPLTERLWVLRQLQNETVGGALLIVAAAIALVWANSPWGDTYFEIANITVGPEALHLNLTLATWAADGLLAVFFFVAGLELKHELVKGSLSKPAQAAVPVAAAFGGMAIPAAIYFAVNAASSRRVRPRAGESRWPPTSPSRWRCSRWSAADCRWHCARSC